MQILIKNVKNLLSEKLSISQRGLLITLLLCKDVSEKLTLAKFKTFVKIKDFRSDLIYLHENRYIKWSGYNYAKKEESKSKYNPTVHEVINFMNELYGRRFDPTKDSSTSELRNRLKDYSIDDIKLVISNRYEVWKDNDKMKQHLNPTTIFRKKLFEKYFEEASRTNVGKGILTANKIDLKDGDTLTYENVQSFVDKDLYTIKTYQVDLSGDKFGNGKVENHYGHVVKKLLNNQRNLKNRGLNPNKIHIFVQR